MWFLLGSLIVLVVMSCTIYFIVSKISYAKFSYETDAVDFFLSLLISLLIILACGFIDKANQKYEYYNTRDIVAMQDSQSYIVSRHDVESGMKYYYMYKSGEDTFRASQAPSNRSSIHTSTDDFRVEIYKKKSTIKFFRFFLPSDHYVDAYKYEFYIPKDSIVSEFKVDLK